MQTSADDIAVIGLALRLPGADTLDELFGHLTAGRSLISEVPPERWSKERYFGDPRRGAEKTSSVWGGFIDNADCFDAAFFRISPREAESMDPQQRFALELAWKAIEDAGYRASEFAGTETGVFMGVCHADYAELMERDRAKTDAYFPTGTAYSIISNRVSYHFDLQGPSITNDTACSSSLVSVYEAVSALQRGECGLALAGGVNLCWSPKHFIAFSQAGMLSRTGRSRAFDQDADGYVRGEGGAVLLLKPLARAIEDRDPVHAVIKGIATNHGGRTSSLTVTNPAAQAQLIEGLYTRAGIRPETVSYIEAHGPGTPVGDPIEIIALKRAFQNLHAAQGTEARPASCGVGSVKTNIGHLEGAAGVAGMAKVIASLAGRTLPATAGFEAQNKLIKLDGSPFFIVRDTQPWGEPDRQDGPLRAGVSSFGFGGTNAHVVLEEYGRVRDEDQRGEDVARPELVPLSARTSDQLRDVARELLDHLRAPHTGDGAARRLADIAYTLRIGREPMAARVAFVAASLPELGASLASFVDGALAESAVHGDAHDTPGLLSAATRWAEGETDTVDAVALHGLHGGDGGGDRRRVRLPTYPFARDRHWFRIPEASVEGAVEGAAGSLRPPSSLVRRNTSSDAREQRYSATFTGDEPFLAAHQVRGARVLPAAAHLEMARAAVRDAHDAASPGATAGLRLRDVTFLRPVVAADATFDVHVGLAPGNGRAFGYQLYTGASTHDPSCVIHSRGTAEVGGLDTPEPVDLTARRAACPARRAPGDVYAAFHDQGLEYGAAMRGLAEIFVGTDELVARIARPATTPGGPGPVLPPSVLDAALQGSVLLMQEAGGADARPQGPALPFALDALEVHGPCPDDTWAWVRRRSGGGSLDTFDIDLCDAEGVIAVRLRGLVQRRAPVASASVAASGERGAGALRGGADRVVTATGAESPVDTAWRGGVGAVLSAVPGERAPGADSSGGGAGRVVRATGAQVPVDTAWRGAGAALPAVPGERAPGADSSGGGAGRVVTATGAQVPVDTAWRGAGAALPAVPGERVPGADSSGGGAGRVVTATCRWVDAPLAAASGPGEDDLDAQGPTAQGLAGLGPTVQGSTAQGLTGHAATAQGPTAQGLTVGLTVQGPAAGLTAHAATALGSTAQGPIVEGLAAQGLTAGLTAHAATAQGPTAQDLTAQDLTAQDLTAQDLTAQDLTAQGPTAQGLTAGLTVQGPAAGLTAHAATALGSTAQGPIVEGLAAQGLTAGLTAHAATAQDLTAQGPATHGPVVHGFIAGGGSAVGVAGGSLTALPDITRDRVADGVDAVLGVVFARVQELMRSRPRHPQRVIVLVDDRVPRHFHAPLAGLLQTAATENPLVSGRVVRIAGLDAATPERVAAVLAAEAAAPAGPGDVRYAHDGTRQEWRPVDIELGEGPQAPPLRDGGVYWLTGGLGGLGRHFARYMARSGRVTVVLSGRSAPGAASDAALRELRAVGVDAYYRAVDVGRREDVEQAVRDIAREHGSLDGIVHAAGVLRDGYLLTKDAAELPAVLEPKVRGAMNLDAATRDLALDFFAVFSSVAGVYGNSGQADYAAANAFLDAFAHHRQALVDIGERSGRTVAVSWPLWADGGMTVDAVTRESMRKQRGWEPLPTEDGLRVFGRVLGDAPGHVVVAYGADPTLSPARRDERPAAPAPVSASPATAVAAADRDLTEPTEELLKRVLGEVLHHDPDAMDTTVNLVEYGIDSLAILETTARLEEHFGALPKTVFFEYVTIEDVAGYFLASHRATLEAILGADAPAEAAPEAGPQPAAPEAVAAAVEPLTVAERPTAPSRDDYHDIAVIGISGTYPGADTMDELWSLLEEGRHTFEEVPRDRWDHDAIYSRDRAVLGKSSIRTGTFLRGIDAFDPRYFRISKRDAEQMSPEVRLFLQTGVEAMEDAGYSRETIQRQYGGDVGVLVGAMSNHYGLYGFQNSLTRGSAASGSYTGTLPNMLSYFYGLTGPSIFLDTMCSGSSACVHQAVQMLRARECKMVVAGGVNLLLHPYNLISSSQEHFTTATSDVIRSFGHGADGTILGEGVGAVVLKPLVEAERDGDHVYAVIKGTALTNAGVRNGFTVPSPRAQARAVEKAIDDAGVDPRTISYVEGHGSGTSLGDPIEVKALTDAFRKHTEDTQFCALGSVKSNLGHLLHAAGMIGFAKVILQMRKGTLAPSLHSDELNPDIDFSGTPFRVQRALAPWEPVAVKAADGRVVTAPRRAGITSIGAGGMNSHIILEEYPGAPGPHDVRDGRDELFVFSAMTDDALETTLARFRAYLTGADESELPSIGFTLRVGKNELPRRWAFFASDTRGAVEAVDRYLAGDRDLTTALHSDDPRTAAARDLGTTWAGGKSVDWARLGDPRRLRRVPLPAYPFDRLSCWVTPEPGAPSVLAPLALRDKLHPFLGRNESDVDGLRYTLDVRLDDLLDYGYQRGRERDITPAFALDVALAVARISGIAADPATARVRDLRVLGPLDWTATERLTITLDTARPEAAHGAVFAEDASGTRTRVVEFDLAPDGAPGPARPRESLRFDAVRTLDRPEALAELAEGGLDYEPMLCGIDSAAWLRDGRLVLVVTAPELQRDHTKPGVTLAPHVLAALDQGAHLVAKCAGMPHWERQTWLHTADVRLHTGAPDVAYAVLDLAAEAEAEAGALTGSVTLLGPGGEVAVELTGVRYGDHDTPARDVPQQDVPRRDTPRDVPRDTPRDGGVVSFVVDELRGMASDILKFDADELDVHTGFDAFGFDSISLVTLSKRIHERFGIDVSPAVFFDVRTFDALGHHLATEYEEPVRAAHEAQGPRMAPVPVREVAEPAAAPVASPVPDSGDDTPMPIAVIGAAGRFPGAPDLDTYWANLIGGKDSVTEFPRHRYDDTYARVVDEADFPRHAGVLDDVDAFDAGFFRIYPREAELMDPQHRLALEAVWGALEDSAYTRADLPRNTGLFLGVSGTDYATLLTTYGIEPDAFTSTGNAHSMLVNRVSYVLDVRGPSQPVDTACSSSLIAVHRALDAVRSGACDVAIAGGVNLLLSVDTFVSAQRAGMLSPDGRCKTFARDADGYVRGEGVGAIVLKPLADAERDGDAILAVLRGSAENHGGRANSLTAPNADAQTELVTAALGDLDPDTIGYIETHGTGTALGDPVEVRALQGAFRRLGGGDSATCGLGSVKSNIGHLEAAAGIAGLLKVILAMRHGVLPATRHCAEINPFIQLDEGPFHIVRENEPWPRPRGGGRVTPRRAGVSSFGFGGSNCHVVVEEYVPKAIERGSDGPSEGASVIVPISARTDEQLQHIARRLLAHLGDPGRSDTLPSIAWTLQTGREAMERRAGWVVASREELADRLRAFVERGERGSAPDGDLGALLTRWTEGGTVEWRTLHGTDTPLRAHLPTYPFARERYWIPGTETPADTGTEADASARSLLPVIGTTLLVPRWARQPATPSGEHIYARHLVILCGATATARDAVERRVPGVRCHTVTTAKQRLESRFTDISRQVFETVREVAAEPAAGGGATLVQVVVPTDGDDATLLALAGLLRTAALESPRFTGQVIGLDGAATDATASTHATDATHATDDTVATAVADNARTADGDVIRYDDGLRTVQTWDVPVPNAAAGIPWRAGGTYLITGGASGIGAIVARHIAHGVERPTLVLVGRRAKDNHIDALLGELRAAGAVARYERADISRWEEVRHLVAHVREVFGEPHGIVHSAGIIRDATLATKTVQEWDGVLAPKVDGLVHLDRATANAPLDFVLTFSSGAALTGNPGQADYATANAFLDAFATLRTARVAAGERSGRTLSIAWPLWNDGGMAVDEATRAYLWHSRGLAPMQSVDGLAALVRAWRLGADRVWVHHGDPDKALQTAQYSPLDHATSTPGTPHTVPAPRPRPKHAASERAGRQALHHLLDLFARVTKAPREAVDADEPIGAMGLDSIMVVQLNKELSTRYGDVSKTLFYEHPTLRAVAGHLATEHASPAPEDIAPVDTAPVETTVTPDPAQRPEPQAAPSPGAREPIAIIGMSGRYPQAENLTAFWENLKAGRDCVGEVPADRWSLDGFYEPDRATALATGRSYSKWGGFLDDFAAFDPLHFQIAPRDAYAMDPQERLFLQASWEVLEDAGYAREELARRHRRRVGVFAGVTKTGHARHGVRRLPSGETAVPVVSFASLSARTSYALDLHGPSLTLDTMCSASLTAIHEACEHLHQGACELAIAGGVNLYLHPLDYIELCGSTMLSADARCRSFGSGGDGFVPGEGVGCVLLKPLSRALADGDRVLAVVRGTSINHGGRSNGYTVPNPGAQAELIRDAMTRAGVSAREVSYVEAHGTGTELGDPIEVKGLTLAFEQDTPDRQYCALGSVKSGIGHLEAAAGVAGLTKAVLQLRHGQLVPSLHAEEPNPNIAFEGTPFFVQRELSAWESDGPRIASVSSFGAGGSNAHVILEEYVTEQPPATGGGADGAEHIVVLSARTPEQLHISAARLATFLDTEDVRLADLAFTLQVGREAMKERLAVVASSVAELRLALRAFADSGDGEDGHGVPGVYRATAGRAQGALAEIAADDDLRDLLVQRWARAGKTAKLAALWVEGVEPDWHALHAPATPRRIALPTYPFAKDRYWIGDLDPVTDTVDTAATAPVAARPIQRAAVVEQPADPAPQEPLDAQVARVVRGKLAKALAMRESEVEGGHAFADYGIDSILGVRLVHDLNETLALDLPTSVIYDHSTADRLTAHILGAHRPVVARPEPRPGPATTPATAPATTPSGTGPATPRPPVAIVGISGRFAGSDSPEELWEHLAAGHDLVGEATRWDVKNTGAAKRCTRGGFLDHIDEFDPLFFNISGVEAAIMDPQQRLLLEESWKALEDAGYAGHRMSGVRCGVYVGCWDGDYQELLGEEAPAQAFWGNTASFIPSRISYFLNLKGPAIAVDTSCSSSLVAIDLACKDLAAGETSMALAGGVYIQSTPRLYDLAGRAGMLSPTGRCHTFDHRADGFVPGEAVGALVLKRLDDALADGDHVYGVIRASGVNHDGATNGITAPSSASQESLLREVYGAYGIDVEHIGLVEAHGTGTKLGDPIEFRALTRAFREGTDKSGYCALGSVKTNLGHTQHAAGVAGVLKVLLALKHRQIPASLHFETANEAVALDGSPFYVSTRTHGWETAPGVPRRAVVSSFGASGTNAHLVIDEGPAAAHAPAPRPAYLVALSAHSRDQLAQQLTRLAAHLRREPGLDCGDVAHTLMAGREHFAHRFACVVRDREELVRALDEGLGGPRAFTGETVAAGGQADSTRLGEEALRRCSGGTAHTDAPLAYRTDLELLAELFVQGAALDYATVFPETARRRVPLPTYPFARERHWPTEAAADVSPAAPAPAAPAPEVPAVRHPMVAPPAPDADGGHRATATLTGDESYLRDHTVHGRRILPGVAHLEMARAAAAHALGADATTPLRMRNVTWVRALAVEGAPVDVDVRVKPVRDGGGVSFEIASGAAEPSVHSEGRIARSDTPRPAPLDLAALRADCPNTVSPARVAGALRSMGIVHGASLRAIDEAYTGPGLVVARLALPEAADHPDGSYVLHPAMMDSAIQASMALHLAEGAEGPRDTAIPFALDRLELFAPCTPAMWAVVRVADGAEPVTALSRLDIDLVDDTGAVCVAMTGYTSRRVPEPVPSLYAPVWEPLAAVAFGAPVPSAADRVLVVGGTAGQRAAITARCPHTTVWSLAPDASIDEVAGALDTAGPLGHLVWIAPDTALPLDDAAGLVTAQRDGVLAAFRMVKALLRTRHDARPLGLTLVTRRAVPAHATDEIRPAHAGLHGLFGSLGQEYPNWTVRRLDLDGDTEWPADLAALPAHSHGDTWVRRAGQWLGRRLAPCDTEATGTERRYREGGVYVVIGGAGGLGAAWTEQVVERYGARVVWIGRRERDAEIDARLRGIRGRGEVRYLAADATDPAALARAHAEIIDRYGHINGVVQAALVLRDQSLANMDEDTFRASLAAKVDVSAAMAEVFATDDLDFAVFFSSIQSFTTAAGQSNYASGCTFADAYAHALSGQWRGPVKVMNWGWWGSIGSVASDFHRERMARWGLLSIEPPEGMAALATLLGGPQRQLSFVKLTEPAALGPIDPATRLTVYERDTAARIPADALRARSGLADSQEILRTVADWRAERDTLLGRMTRGHLEAMGVVRDGETYDDTTGATSDLAALRARGGILERYTIWLEHALRTMPGTAPPLDALNQEWKERCAEWSADPDKRAELRLVDATLGALPDILTGRTRPTDIMFPRGSLELVEGCYKNNRVADTFNRAMADAAVGVVSERLRLDPDARLRVLEIGAGTGGTSVGLFAALRPYQDHIETYTYTDLSKAFLNHAQSEYGPEVPYLDTTRLDAEQPLAGQGIEVGGYDLVVAANVLHATRDTRTTLRNAKSALRDGGWLLLNELCSFDVFSHLTFGLLEGWWLFEDASLRIPGSPALSPESWRDVLHSEGFPSVVLVLPQARALGQQIIAAESDGIARRPVPGAGAAPAPVPVANQPVAVEPTPDEPAVAGPSDETRAATMVAYLKEKAAATLKIPAEKIDPSVSLIHYGMDSILVLQLANALREDFDDVSPTLLFDAESVDELSAHFLDTYRDRVDALVLRRGQEA
ncbi:SDR family NAD(P)-dependent oxidoreductase [Streptomyces sp. NPDC005962]|uniref:SDR family NAD(P)-dependent oxidoreductase n=1 Tax=Streptomyces sp. NPDC005962 TaxID=3154466 RepID=UPI0033FCEE57